MKLYEIVFSPTGGTERVSFLLSHAFQGEHVRIDLTESRQDFSTIQLQQDDAAVISVPSYGGRVPETAAERLAMLKGNGARAVIAAVYGNRAYEDTLVELRDIAVMAGFHVIAAVSTVAEHSIVRKIAAGRPDSEDAARLAGFGKKIQEKISSMDLSEPVIPGSRPYRKAGGAGMVPKPTNRCSSCGICAEKCPVQAIDRSDPKKVNEKACISCMRCVSVCPLHARRVNPLMLKAADIMLKKACAGRKECELYL